MTVTVTITNTDNAAFGDDETDARAEAARIIRKAAEAIEQGSDRGRLRDINGNSVGSFEVGGDDAEA
jgi:hypothetical protein